MIKINICQYQYLQDKMQNITLAQSFSKCCPWTKSISFNQRFVKNVNSEFTESEFLELKPINMCFNKLYRAYFFLNSSLTER